MRSRHLVLVFVLSVWGTAQATELGEVVGRIAFEGPAGRVLPKALYNITGSSGLRLELRQGQDVFAVMPDGDGFFHLKLPAGEYRIEYVIAQDQAEYFEPHTISVVPRARVCIGSFILTMRDVAKELGQNMGSTLLVVDECPSSLQRAATSAHSAQSPQTRLAAVQPRRRAAGHGLIEYASGLRVGADYSAGRITPRGSFLFGVNGTLSRNATLLLHLTAGWRSRGIELGGGVGGRPLEWLELATGGAYRPGHAGADAAAVLHGTARVGHYGYGVGLRAELAPPRAGGLALFFTAELSPAYVLGSLL